jgi:hypothetical protein
MPNNTLDYHLREQLTTTADILNNIDITDTDHREVKGEGK